MNKTVYRIASATFGLVIAFIVGAITKANPSGAPLANAACVIGYVIANQIVLCAVKE